MATLRFGIGRLMIAVAILAINLGVLRLLYQTRRVDLLFGGALLWATFEAGVFLAIRNRNRSRPFWAGSVVAGSLATFSYVAARAMPESVVAAGWTAYLHRAEIATSRMIDASLARNGHPAVHEILYVLALALAVYLPILLWAGTFGWLTRRLAKAIRRSSPPADS